MLRLEGFQAEGNNIMYRVGQCTAHCCLVPQSDHMYTYMYASQLPFQCSFYTSIHVHVMSALTPLVLLSMAKSRVGIEFVVIYTFNLVVVPINLVQKSLLWLQYQLACIYSSWWWLLQMVCGLNSICMVRQFGTCTMTFVGLIQYSCLHSHTQRPCTHAGHTRPYQMHTRPPYMHVKVHNNLHQPRGIHPSARSDKHNQGGVRCLALQNQGWQVKKLLFCPGPPGTLPTHLSGSWTWAARLHTLTHTHTHTHMHAHAHTHTYTQKDDGASKREEEMKQHRLERRKVRRSASSILPRTKKGPVYWKGRRVKQVPVYTCCGHVISHVTDQVRIDNRNNIYSS